MAEVVGAGPGARPARHAPLARTLRSAAWVLAVAGGLAVLVLAGLMLVRLSDPRGSVDLTTGVAPAAYLAQAPDEVREVTSSVCPERVGCVQAAQSDRVLIVRFEDPDQAREEASRMAPYAWPSDHLVVQFLDPSSMTPEDFQYVEKLVDGAGERALPLVDGPPDPEPEPEPEPEPAASSGRQG